MEHLCEDQGPPSRTTYEVIQDFAQEWNTGKVHKDGQCWREQVIGETSRKCRLETQVGL